jgi:hypothetical protein
MLKRSSSDKPSAAILGLPLTASDLSEVKEKAIAYYVANGVPDQVASIVEGLSLFLKAKGYSLVHSCVSKGNSHE